MAKGNYTFSLGRRFKKNHSFNKGIVNKIISREFFYFEMQQFLAQVKPMQFLKAKDTLKSSNIDTNLCKSSLLSCTTRFGSSLQ
jgi:hypothetical protein